MISTYHAHYWDGGRMRFRVYEVDDADPCAIVRVTGAYAQDLSITTAQLRAAGDELAQAWLIWCSDGEPEPQDDDGWVVRVLLLDNGTVFGEVENEYDAHGCFPLEQLFRMLDIQSKKKDQRPALEGAQESLIETFALHVKANSPSLKVLYDGLVADRRARCSQ